MYFRLLLLPVLAAVGSVACGATNGDPASQTQVDLRQAANESTTILSCTDTTNASVQALLTVDAAYRFSWKIGEMEPRVSSVTRATKDVYEGLTSYSFQLASGEILAVRKTADSTEVSFLNARAADCSPETVVSEGAIAPLLAATATSLDQKRTFATCDVAVAGAPEHDTFTVRPSFDAHGAIFELAGYENFEGNPMVVLLAQTQSMSSERTVYKGEGGVVWDYEGVPVLPFTELSVSGTAPAAIQWDARDPIPQTTCEVPGADYAASLLR